MISFTNSAKEKLLEIIENENLEGQTLRIRVEGGGCGGFVYDLAFEGEGPSELDESFIVDKINVAVDQLSWHYLDGTEIDWVESFFEGGFRFNNPNVKATCGCGASFSV